MQSDWLRIQSSVANLISLPKKGVSKQAEKFQKWVNNHNCGESAVKVQALLEAEGLL
jgi:hypothetical protein